jgi:hypothetical protein
MELQIHRPRAVCSVSGRPFAPGDVMHSALVRGRDGLERRDVHVEAWTGPPPAALAVWRSTVPEATAAGPTIAPVDVLLDLLEGLDGRPDEAVLRYLLALQLVRRRVLKIAEGSDPQNAGGDLVLACRRRDREFRVPVALPEAGATAEVGKRLTTLLWSGEAA